MTIDPATFAGTTAPVGVTEFDGSGSAIVAFRTAAGNVGWYKLTFETAGPVHYGPGQLGTNGEAVNVDDSSNSCPFEIGDVNADRLINLLDVAPFIDLIANSGFECQADVNEDLAVDLLDVEPFITILLNN